MLLISITIIEHEDLSFDGAIYIEEPDLAIIRYKNENEELLITIQAPEIVLYIQSK